MEINEHLSDLTLSSQNLQKKIQAIDQEFKSNGTLMKTHVPQMMDMFEEYRKNIIKIREEDLADGIVERIASRMETQTNKCIFQLDKLLEGNLSPNQILSFMKPEIVNVTALNMLDLDDTRSTWSRDDDDQTPANSRKNWVGTEW